MATLLPWNFFITPFAYWMSKLTIANATDVDVDGDSTDEGVAAAVAMTEAVANVTAVVLNTLKEDRSALGLPADPDSGNQSCASGGSELNDYQKFWGSLLGITTM